MCMLHLNYINNKGNNVLYILCDLCQRKVICKL